MSRACLRPRPDPAMRARKGHEESIAAGVGYLESAQFRSGQFRTLASVESSFRRPRRERSAFVTSHIAYSLAFVQDDRAPGIRNRALDFLAQEIERPGMWRWWTTGSPRHEYLPPDADDVACVSVLLKDRHPEILKNRDVLLQCRGSDGRFLTWLIPRNQDQVELWSQWGLRISPNAITRLRIAGDYNNVDGVVNANVLFYLGDRPETSQAAAYLTRVVRHHQEDQHLTYYNSRIALYHAISRCYSVWNSFVQPLRRSIAARTAALLKDGQLNALDTALGICTLKNLGVNSAHLAASACSLLGLQREDGSWPACSMFLGPAPHYGSPELTTAFCVEALSRLADRL